MSAVPNILAIAGSDPSGGAGIQADLKTIQATGGYGMAALTALTAQNTQGVRGVHVPPAAFLGDQLEAISDDVRIDAVKIGMLGTTDVIDVVTRWLAALPTRPAVVLDPVMVATSGDRLLDSDAERALAALLDASDVVTPNLPELAVLVSQDPAGSWGEVCAQARRVAERHDVLVLAKGGHLGGDACPDALVGSRGVVAEFTGARIHSANTHGTGCSLSSALASIQARTDDWAWSARLARTWVRDAIEGADALDVGRPGGHGPLDHAHALRRGERAPRREAELDAWWEDIAGIRAGIEADEFVRTLADGSLDADRFAHYLRQDALYLEAYAEVLSRAGELAPSVQEREFWRACARECIETEMALHRSRVDEPAREMSPETAAYVGHLQEAADGGDHPVLLAAVLPCFWIYDRLGQRLAAIRTPEHPYADWLETYDAPEFTAATEQAIAWTQQAARRADDAEVERMRAAFVESSRLERVFFSQETPAA